MAALTNLLTDIDGVSVGNVTDLSLGSGVTAIVFEKPAIASVSVLGGAPGGRDTGLLDPAMTVETVDAFVLSGGLAFGLDAAGGVQAGLREIGRGLQVGSTRVPIVPQAILMDLLNGGDKDWGLRHGVCGFQGGACGALRTRDGRCRDGSNDRDLQGRAGVGKCCQFRRI